MSECHKKREAVARTHEIHTFDVPIAKHSKKNSLHGDEKYRMTMMVC